MNFFTYGNASARQKARIISWLKGLDPSIKRMIIMRINLVAFLISITIVNVSASVRAQSISLNFKQAEITDVLAAIKKQSGYQFLYNNTEIKKAKPVTVTLKNAILKDALDRVFNDQPLSYQILDQTIVIKLDQLGAAERTTPAKKIGKITGKVTNEKGEPVSGVTVKLKDSNLAVITDEAGIYTIEAPGDNAVLLFSYVGYESVEVTIKGDTTVMNVTLKESIGMLSEIDVVSTGYQQIPKERATGSFVQIDNQLLNRKVSTNILDRIDGIAPGIFNTRLSSIPEIAINPSDRNTGFVIRGVNTFRSSTEPLIVVDNFPYEGEISNINPNDVESITVLKDAAAASIWGARSANGVIVITTKKGRFNQKPVVEANTNVSIVQKPDLFYSPDFINPASYVDLEKDMFARGFFDNILADNIANPAVSPAVTILAQQRAGTLTDEQASAKLEELKVHDVRRDYEKYVYQIGVNQQYSLGIRGGGSGIAYQLSAGYDNNQNSLRRNGYSRTSVNSSSTYLPFKNLELSAGINYSQSSTALSNNLRFGAFSGNGYPYGNIFPYARLADDGGNPLNIPYAYSETYIDNILSQGMLDWSYNPLHELQASDKTTKVNDVLLRVGAKYKISSFLNFQANYQNERQIIQGRNLNSQETYYTRNLINRFAVYDATTRATTFNVPLGGILTLDNTNWYSNNLRTQLDYDQSFGTHSISAIAGAELRELKTDTYSRLSYGYSERTGTSVSNLNFGQSYPVNPAGADFIPASDGSVFGTLNRYVSYYSNAAYTYKSRYILSLSARADGANLFGAKTNDKFAPLWSAGVAWLISSEPFFKARWLPYFKLRGTYGYNGNTNQNTTAYLTAVYITDASTGAIVMARPTAPNPDLRWEKVRNINIGVDFATAQNIITGTFEFYQKNGTDLIQPTPLAPQTGFTSYNANTANIRTRGIDITLESQNFNGPFKWSTTLLLSGIKGKVIKFDGVRTRNSISSGDVVVGRPLEASYSFRWAGLDPATGDPMGYLNGQPSTNYTSIINNFDVDSLVYNGSYRPTVFGNFRNDISFRNFAISINLSYRLGYILKTSSTSLNYADLLLYGQHDDYNRRWQKPGDEATTYVPSLSYNSNSDRNFFFRNATPLVRKGDHIRLQDIRLSYDLPGYIAKRINSSRVRLYSYASNLGVLWRKDKTIKDPDATASGLGGYPNPLSISFGLNINF